jgi:hypothetical protein
MSEKNKIMTITTIVMILGFGWWVGQFFTPLPAGV